MDKPFSSLKKKEKDIVLFGSPDFLDYTLTSVNGNKMNRHGYIEGVKTRIERLYRETTSPWMSQYYESFMRDSICATCHGARLNEAALSVQVGGLNMAYMDPIQYLIRTKEQYSGDLLFVVPGELKKNGEIRF